jgi:hypothetical protein
MGFSNEPKKNRRFRVGSFFDYCEFSQNCNYEALTNYLIFELVGKVSIYGSVDGLFLKETQNNRF